MNNASKNFILGLSIESKFSDKARHCIATMLKYFKYSTTMYPVKVHLRVAQAANALGVCIRTIQRWDTNQKIQCYRTPGGHRRIAISEIRRIQGKKSVHVISKGTAIYARVSSYDQKQKGDLERQINKARQNNDLSRATQTPVYVFQDVAIELNTKRRGLKKLFQAVEQG